MPVEQTAKQLNKLSERLLNIGRPISSIQGTWNGLTDRENVNRKKLENKPVVPKNIHTEWAKLFDQAESGSKDLVTKIASTTILNDKDRNRFVAKLKESAKLSKELKSDLEHITYPYDDKIHEALVEKWLKSAQHVAGLILQISFELDNLARDIRTYPEKYRNKDEPPSNIDPRLAPLLEIQKELLKKQDGPGESQRYDEWLTEQYEHLKTITKEVPRLLKSDEAIGIIKMPVIIRGYISDLAWNMLEKKYDIHPEFVLGGYLLLKGARLLGIKTDKKVTDADVLSAWPKVRDELASVNSHLGDLAPVGKPRNKGGHSYFLLLPHTLAGFDRSNEVSVSEWGWSK